MEKIFRPYVSVIIPCRNEDKYIGKIVQELIKGNTSIPIEVLVVDGMSTDKTREIVSDLARQYPGKVRLIDNPEKYVPQALNRGIQAAKGDILMVISAHAIYPPNYVEQLVKWLESTDAWNVGPIIRYIPSGRSQIAKAISRAMNSIFGVGLSRWKIGVKKPTYADTIAFFCMRKDIPQKVGLFNPLLKRNQDAEFNARILKSGGKVMVVPDIVVKVYARPNLSKLFKQFLDYGYYRALSARIIGKFVSFRQLVPPLFFLSLFLFTVLSLFIKRMWVIPATEVSIYLITALTFSVYEAFKSKNPVFVFTLPVVYLTMHFAFALGFLISFMKFFIIKSQIEATHER